MMMPRLKEAAGASPVPYPNQGRATDRLLQHAECGVRAAVRARVHPRRERLPRLFARDSPGSFACHVAVADVHVYGGSPVEALLDHPVRGWGPRLFAALLFGLPLLLLDDPPVDLVELVPEEAFDDAELLQAGRARRVGHVFDSTRVGPSAILGAYRGGLMLRPLIR